jgi:hypothetical protein
MRGDERGDGRRHVKIIEEYGSINMSSAGSGAGRAGETLT